ncbi:enoyl-CoA hydratase/isomerase family protein [Pseudomonadota bacterium]
MNEMLIRENVAEGMTQLTLNRAPVNALNPELLAEIEAQLIDIDGDKDIRALIITSGLSVFSAGMDLKEAQKFSIDEQTAIVDALNSSFMQLYGMSKPVIVAINGAAIAGGLFFVLASDYTVAREGAKFGLTEVRVGVRFPVVAIEMARAALSPIVFRRLLLSGRNVDTDTAKAMGVIDEIVSAGKLKSRALAVAQDYASIPPVAYAGVKAQMRAEALGNMKNAISDKTDPTRLGWFSDETRTAMEELLVAATSKN